MPAYDLNWEEFAKHKLKGGTLKDFPQKQFSKLTEQRIINHLTGKEVIGVYPLLPDKSSWFIVADFDENLTNKRNWIEECRIFLNACQHHHVPAYLERSRSGSGGHVWIFFNADYPTYKSRKMILNILESTGIISPFDKNSNYERLFPNQDYHSGKSLGNLISLLQKKAIENNNSCFIDPVATIPFIDQWIFLENIQKISVDLLNKIFHRITNSVNNTQIGTEKVLSSQNEIKIIFKQSNFNSKKRLNT